MEATFYIQANDIVKCFPELLLSPANPTPHETIFLSNIDQTVAFPIETVFFYRTTNEESTRDVYDRVKASFRDVLLIDYYFLAGRFHLNPDTKRLEMACTNAGVPFVHATCRLRLEELGDVSVPNHSFGHLVPRDVVTGGESCGLLLPDDTPLFAVQVTRFACGGFCLGFSCSHSVLDGYAAAEMFNNLAAVCRGHGMLTRVHPSQNDRTCLRARHPPQITLADDVGNGVDPVTGAAAGGVDDLTISTNDKDVGYGRSPASLPLLRTDTHSARVFYFSQNELTALKSKAGRPCSTFQALVGHLWKARTKSVFPICQNNEAETPLSTALFAVDIRSRMNPPLLQGFIGNGVVSAMASLPAASVITSPLGDLVGKVQEAAAAITDGYVRYVVDWMEVHRIVPATHGGNFYVSAWWKLPFHELDFGYGKAMYGGPVVSGMDEFVLLLADGKGEGGVNLWIVLEKGAMERFAEHVYDV